MKSNAAFYASGYFGGFGGQTDYSQLTIKFLDATSSEISSVTFGSTTPGERGGATGLLFKEISGLTPVGTTQIGFLLQMQREQGSANDGYADNLFFSVNPVPEANTYSMLLAGLGLLGVIARRKQQHVNNRMVRP
ncbi:PEP-CTERM sorting domain-containing protein [Methylophilus sp.]|uniref:PEP-CTERM sorting domain-containing protein n=1 Tax=Methylophilus sp. TaxID=29541 RepID=UPI0025F90848|nr:PEP-CTERM sorting domain-containing protein [Methylophilus sp.]